MREPVVDASFARSLEFELATAEREVEAWRNKPISEQLRHQTLEVTKLRTQCTKLREKLEIALEALRREFDYRCKVGTNQERIDELDKLIVQLGKG